MEKLADKVAVIAGCNTGAGLATAQLFAGQGAKVAISNADQPALCAAIERIGHGAMGFAGDISDPQNIIQLYESAAYYFAGKIDVLVINAGPLNSSLSKRPDLSEDTIINNGKLKSGFDAAKRAIPYLNISSSIILAYFPPADTSPVAFIDNYLIRPLKAGNTGLLPEPGSKLNLHVLLPGIIYTTSTFSYLLPAKELKNSAPRKSSQRGWLNDHVAETIFRLVTWPSSPN